MKGAIMPIQVILGAETVHTVTPRLHTSKWPSVLLVMFSAFES